MITVIVEGHNWLDFANGGERWQRRSSLIREKEKGQAGGGGAPPRIFWERAIFWAPPKIFWDSSKDVCERVKILWTPAKIKDKTCQVSSYAACADVMEKSIWSDLRGMCNVHVRWGRLSVFLAKCLHSNRRNLSWTRCAAFVLDSLPRPTNILVNMYPVVICHSAHLSLFEQRRSEFQLLSLTRPDRLCQTEHAPSVQTGRCQTGAVCAKVCPATRGVSEPRQGLRSAAPITLSCSKPNQKWDSLNLAKSGPRLMA